MVPPRNDVVGAEVPDEGDEGDKTMNPAQIGGWWSGPQVKVQVQGTKKAQQGGREEDKVKDDLLHANLSYNWRF